MDADYPIPNLPYQPFNFSIFPLNPDIFSCPPSFPKGIFKFFPVLVQHRNPCPVGKVRVQWLCHLNDSFVITKAELSPQHSKGETNESISKVITNDMVLPISHCMDSKVPVPEFYSGEIAQEVETCIRAFSEQQVVK